MGCATIQEGSGDQQHLEAQKKVKQTKQSLETVSKKSANLKESHSALVKLLESAPISETKGTEPTNIDNFKSTHHQHYRDEPQFSEVSVIQKVKDETFNDSTTNNSSIKTENQQISTVETKQEETSSEKYATWKKTRLAREWREKKIREEEEIRKKQKLDLSLPRNVTAQILDTDDDSMSECEHHHHKHLHRRNSASDDTSSSEYGQNDSGCDSDCPDNINELCKNFSEKLSEENQEVRSKFYSISIYMKKLKKLSS